MDYLRGMNAVSFNSFRRSGGKMLLVVAVFGMLTFFVYGAPIENSTIEVNAKDGLKITLTFFNFSLSTRMDENRNKRIGLTKNDKLLMDVNLLQFALILFGISVPVVYVLVKYQFARQLLIWIIVIYIVINTLEEGLRRF